MSESQGETRQQPGRPTGEERLATAVSGLELRRLRPVDAERYHALVQLNREHLTARGDYLDEVAASADDFREAFADNPSGPPMRFGLWLGDTLVGRCDLVPVDPPRFGLGYWVGTDSQGKGLASAAVAALLDHARTRCLATDVFAGVTHGNTRSISLLRRLGFSKVADFESYARFHRGL